MKVLILAAKERGLRHNRWVAPLENITGVTTKVVLKFRSYIPFVIRALWQSFRFRPHITIIVGPDIIGGTGVLVSKLITHQPLVLFLGGDPVSTRLEFLNTLNTKQILTKLKHNFLCLINSHYIYKNCDHFMVNSYYLRNHLLTNYRYFKKKAIFVVPQSMTIISGQKPKLVANKHKYIRILTVTNLTYRSKYEGAVELVEFLCKYTEETSLDKKFYFTICAGGYYRLHLRKKLEMITIKQNRLCIRYLGFVHDLEFIYKRAHIFLYCSNYDSLPRVLVEAQAHGLPTLVNDFEPFREFIIHGYNGLLYKTGDFEDFKEKLDALIADFDLGYSLSKNALENLKRNYCVKAIGKKLESVLVTVSMRKRQSR